MLTGTPLYTGDTLDAVADLHAFRPHPPAPRPQSPAFPAALEGIIVKCLQKRPDARYPNATGERADRSESGARRPALRQAPLVVARLTWTNSPTTCLPRPCPAVHAGPRFPYPLPPLLQKRPILQARRHFRADNPGAGLRKPAAPIVTSPERTLRCRRIRLQANTMPAKNRLRETDERVSPSILKLPSPGRDQPDYRAA